MGNAEKIVHPQRGISSCDAEHDIRNDACFMVVKY